MVLNVAQPEECFIDFIKTETSIYLELLLLLGEIANYRYYEHGLKTILL